MKQKDKQFPATKGTSSFLSWAVANPYMRVGSSISLVCLLCAIDAQASLEGQLDKVQALATGSFLKTGLIVTTVVGALGAAIKGSMGLVLVIIGIGFVLSLYLSWIINGDFIQAIA